MYKVEAKTKTSSGVEFTANSSSNHDTRKFIGSLETKYKWPDYGKHSSNCCCASTFTEVLGKIDMASGNY